MLIKVCVYILLNVFSKNLLACVLILHMNQYQHSVDAMR